MALEGCFALSSKIVPLYHLTKGSNCMQAVIKEGGTTLSEVILFS